MDLFRIEQMHQGWYIGDFTPTAFQTRHCEVGWLLHGAQSYWPKHLHQQITEVNLLVRGRMTAHIKEGAKSLHEGDIFVLHPGEWIKPEFQTECQLVVVKIPGIQGDKLILREDA